MRTLKQLRYSIEKIDSHIIKYLAKRDQISKKIGRIKSKTASSITDREREKKLMQLYEEMSLHYKINPLVIKKLFKMIIFHSKKVQK